MITALIAALSPFVLNSIMELAKWLSGLKQTATLRLLLAVFALAGTVAVSALNGTPVNPDSLSSLLQTALTAFVAFVASHGSYTLFFKSSAPATPPAVA